MRRLFHLFIHKQQSLGSAAITLMLMVIISAVLGLIRLRILYHQFTPEETGVFFAAFRIPNLLFELLAMGSLTAAFIPVFTKYITNSKEDEANKLASGVLNITMVLLIVLSIPVVIFIHPISRMMAPGFTETQISQMASFTKIMIVFQVIPLVLGNFLTGILQSYKLFFVPALAPIVYNLGIIIGILAFSSSFGLAAPVIGVIIGAILFFMIQLPLIFRSGYTHHWHFYFSHNGVKEVGRLIVPRLIGLGAGQIDLTVDLILSTLMGSRMVTVFFLAQSLQQLPVRLFGSTIAQAALPSLSALSAKEDMDKFKTSITNAYHLILFLVFPASVLLIVLRIPIVRLIYGASLFDWDATVLTAVTVSVFSVSLFAQAVSHVFVRGFYALYNSRTPVKVSIATILLNSFLSTVFVLVWKLPLWSLALSSSIASIANALTLIYLMNKHTGGFPVKDIILSPLKMCLASVIMGFIIYVPMKLLDELVIDTTRVIGLFTLTGFVSVFGIISYIFISWSFGVIEWQTILSIYTKFKKLRELISQPSNEVVSGEVSETSA